MSKSKREQLQEQEKLILQKRKEIENKKSQHELLEKLRAQTRWVDEPHGGCDRIEPGVGGECGSSSSAASESELETSNEMMRKKWKEKWSKKNLNHVSMNVHRRSQSIIFRSTFVLARLPLQSIE